MTVEQLAKMLELTPHCVSDAEREVSGGYAGDLLSWVMGRATSGDAWVTIMSNINVIAVAQLTDAALVVLSEGVVPDDELVKAAETRGVNLYSSNKPTFELAGRIFAMLGSREAETE